MWKISVLSVLMALWVPVGLSQDRSEATGTNSRHRIYLEDRWRILCGTAGRTVSCPRSPGVSKMSNVFEIAGEITIFGSRVLAGLFRPPLAGEQIRPQLAEVGSQSLPLFA